MMKLVKKAAQENYFNQIKNKRYDNDEGEDGRRKKVYEDLKSIRYRSISNINNNNINNINIVIIRDIKLRLSVNEKCRLFVDLFILKLERRVKRKREADEQRRHVLSANFKVMIVVVPVVMTLIILL